MAMQTTNYQSNETNIKLHLYCKTKGKSNSKTNDINKRQNQWPQLDSNFNMPPVFRKMLYKDKNSLWENDIQTNKSLENFCRKEKGRNLRILSILEMVINIQICFLLSNEW